MNIEFCLNFTPREDWLMRCHARPYWCARLAALCLVALACAPSLGALLLVRDFLVSIGLLRVSLAGAAPLDESTGAAYVLCVSEFLALAALAFGLWMFRAWAWWLALGGSMILGLSSLFLVPDWLWLVPVLCVVYALLVPSYAIFTERFNERADALA